MNKHTMHKIINALLFQVCWFSAVLWGWQYGLPALILLAAHGYVFERGQHAYAALAGIVAAGLVLDSALFASGWFSVPEPAPLMLGLTPAWLMCMWCAFALTLGSSLSWWRDYPKIFVPVCAIAGPLSYFAGQRLGALEIQPQAYFWHGLAWAVLGLAVVFFIRQPFSKRSGDWRASAVRLGKKQACGLE